MSFKVLLTFILLTSFQAHSETVTGFNLKLTDCKVMGTGKKIGTKVKTFDADTGFLLCRKKADSKTRYNCTFSGNSHSDEYQVHMISGGIGIGVALTGDVKFQLDFNRMDFYFGQVQIHTSGLGVVSKQCGGKIEKVFK